MDDPPTAEALLLVPLSTEGEGKAWLIRDGETRSIGKKAECDIVVNADAVSGHHCTVGLNLLSPYARQEQKFVITVRNIGRSATFVDGNRLEAAEVRYARPGEVLNLGRPTSQGDQKCRASFKFQSVVIGDTGKRPREEALGEVVAEIPRPAHSSTSNVADKTLGPEQFAAIRQEEDRAKEQIKLEATERSLRRARRQLQDYRRRMEKLERSNLK
ncbi:hypothetical protein FOZ63_013421, partial [Perkinsus olseni]